MTRRLSCRFFHQGVWEVERNPPKRSVGFRSFQDFSRIPAQNRDISEAVLLEPLVDLVRQLGLDLDADDAALRSDGRPLEKRQTAAKTDVQLEGPLAFDELLQRETPFWSPRRLLPIEPP